MSAEIIAEPLSDIINEQCWMNKFFQMLKEAYVIPASKKEDRQTKTNYRQISVLNVFVRFFRDSYQTRCFVLLII